jgi:HD-GYP domain-containing protein (c-di-GMP phosphodiesterase class II)
VWLVLGLLAAHALVLRVRFEFGRGFVVPEQLVVVPLMLLGPLNLVPMILAVGSVLGALPDFSRGSWSRDRWLQPVADSWSYLAPVLVLAALAPGPLSNSHLGIYILAFAALVIADFAHTMLRTWLMPFPPFLEVAKHFVGTVRVDVILTPIAFAATLAAADQPIWLVIVLAPLVWMLDNFSKERWARFAAALELNRAYRGTVLLLTDVLEQDDEYTAEHSRSVVDLVNAVADELDITGEERQELEFAAMLHDVGKISIPKEILHKPSALTDPEFEIVKHHTIEGQFMLDRVGGMLGRVGQVVRSCHERWDGLGYPDRLVADEIPLVARIVCCCDAFNAMTTDRPYRAARSVGEALTEVERCSGSHFDPAVAAALAAVVRAGVPEAAIA